MKATATAVGYFGFLRQPGDEFEVPDDTKPASWFKLEDKKSAKRTGKNQPAEGNGDAAEAADTGTAE